MERQEQDVRRDDRAVIERDERGTDDHRLVVAIPRRKTKRRDDEEAQDDR